MDFNSFCSCFNLTKCSSYSLIFSLASSKSKSGSAKENSWLHFGQTILSLNLIRNSLKNSFSSCAVTLASPNLSLSFKRIPSSFLIFLVGFSDFGFFLRYLLKSSLNSNNLSLSPCTLCATVSRRSFKSSFFSLTSLNLPLVSYSMDSCSPTIFSLVDINCHSKSFKSASKDCPSTLMVCSAESSGLRLTKREMTFFCWLSVDRKKEPLFEESMKK